jgi:solute carrier family 12 sodium/potassium/chloride transporter 2
VFLQTLISPSNTAAIIQAIQQPGISGQPNNMMLFEYKKGEREWLSAVLDNFSVLKTAQYDLCILATSDKGFGYKKDIHVWIRKEDYENANLMILLSYIILGHPDWNKGEIKIFATFPKENIAQEEQNLIDLTSSGRLPISANNIRVLPFDENKSRNDLINENSSDADLTLIGFQEQMFKTENVTEFFEGYDKIGNILFVNTLTSKFIK